ncbi:glycoside hydrolase family 95 protein [Sphingobacterium sp. UT-1RO-CII-1]|uniref:glycoside hydrolase family 95 protein n=1 Tax=Sphingobacterium sp. UT-1RO-CII-1 TaxID=2995225 RepID=UPI00227BAB91|nr:glycoside hydrolase family 95 protein [Sphingobacterium sp. UT-1RO-CII-1]MCY4781560.1 glycoside hydrolase family 95 protein [Sphingobacterium sp. UT-1RO-CII-1]
MKRINIFTVALYVFLIINIGKAQERGLNRLWYLEPADATAIDAPNSWNSDPEWLKALPVGNGSIGAMVYGDVHQERIQLNEISMWSGSVDDGDNPEAAKYLAEIRSLLFQGKYKEATALTNRTQITKGKGSGHGNGAQVPFGCYQTLGDLRLDFRTQGPYQDYYRDLDLKTGIATTRFVKNNVQYKREVFASYPDQVIVVRLTADKAAALDLDIFMDRPERFTTEVTAAGLMMSGVLDDGRGGYNLKYKAQITPVLKGGNISVQDGKLAIRQAHEVTLFIAAKTNYALDYPRYLNDKYELQLEAIREKVLADSYKEILSRHINDFSQVMGRVEMRLGKQQNKLPTNELLHKNKQTGNEQSLYPLYFQYGRYLLFSSSRIGSLPSNLQGIWANKIQTPWNGDYHTDINVQMNYWPAEVTNLSESHLPLIDLIESLMEPGKKTAKVQYGMRGWVLHPITNVWGFTSPGESASWGMHIGGGAWIAQHLWEHYAFTGDRAYLERVYPMMKEASLFYLDWLVVDPKSGKLVSGPSPSPENTFLAPDGTRAQISMGPEHDQQVIRNLFKNTINAAAILDRTDDGFIDAVKKAKEKLLPSQIGSDGRLMEWAQEFEEVEIAHRHLSHLFALYPGNEISVARTPELASAVKRSLEVRGDDGVGWTYGWKIALWARLLDGDHALMLLNKALKPTFDLDTKHDGGGGAYYNLFNAGPPFQIDGNFGVTAGMAEMFLQSHEDYIELLPALPTAWEEGEIKGLVARGGVEIDMVWKNGRIVNSYAKARQNGLYNIKYGQQVLTLNLQAGKRVKLKIKS